MRDSVCKETKKQFLVFSASIRFQSTIEVEWDSISI